MTVLIRDEMNHADLAWATADALVAAMADEERCAGRGPRGEPLSPAGPASRGGRVVEPDLLRARGAL